MVEIDRFIATLRADRKARSESVYASDKVYALLDAYDALSARLAASSADPAAGYYRAAGIEPWADFDGTLSHPDEPETRDATRKAAAMMKVSIPGDEKSHFPTMKDGAVRLLNLRVVVHNCSNAPLRNVRALLTGVALASAKADPVIGHNVRLPCANLSDDVYAPTEIPIGGWEPFGVVFDRENGRYLDRLHPDKTAASRAAAAEANAWFAAGAVGSLSIAAVPVYATPQPAVPECPWQDMSTAPKDGSEFQAWLVSDYECVGASWAPRCRIDPEDGTFEVWRNAYCDHDGGLGMWDILIRTTPTHWMPRPAAPKGAVRP